MGRPVYYSVLRSDAKLRDAVYAQGQFLVTWEWRKLKPPFLGLYMCGYYN